MITTVVAGNPKPLSRTLAAGVKLAELLTGAQPTNVIDVIALGPGLLGWGDPAVADAVATVKSSDLVIFASPTYKGSYSGVLKLFLDQFETASGLAGTVAVPLMLGAGPVTRSLPSCFSSPCWLRSARPFPARASTCSTARRTSLHPRPNGATNGAPGCSALRSHRPDNTAQTTIPARARQSLSLAHVDN